MKRGNIRHTCSHICTPAGGGGGPRSCLPSCCAVGSLPRGCRDHQQGQATARMKWGMQGTLSAAESTTPTPACCVHSLPTPIGTGRTWDTALQATVVAQNPPYGCAGRLAMQDVMCACCFTCCLRRPAHHGTQYHSGRTRRRPSLCCREAAT
jgi:hypothetical protein